MQRPSARPFTRFAVTVAMGAILAALSGSRGEARGATELGEGIADGGLSVTLTSNRTTVTAGSPITFTAMATGGATPYRYTFWLNNGRYWRTWDQGADNVWTYTPTEPGNYTLQVWVRVAGSVALYDTWTEAKFIVGEPDVLTVTDATTLYSRFAGPGCCVEWDVTAVGGDHPYSYKYWVYDGERWSVGQDWTPYNSWLWTLPRAGTYTFQVWVRNAGSTADYDAWRAFGPYTVGRAPKFSVIELTPDVKSPPANTPVTWTATTDRGSGIPTYQFWLYDGAAWAVVQDWSPLDTWTWIPPAAGSYRVQAWARNGDYVACSPVPFCINYDAFLDSGPYTVTSPTTLGVESLVPDRATPIPAGTPVRWTARAAGGAGPYTYQFWLYDGVAWSVSQDWSSANTWTWIPTATGTYAAQVWVRNAGSVTRYDGWAGSSMTVSAAAPLSVPSVIVTPMSPLIAGEPATVVATASGGTGPYTYKYYVFDGSTWTLGQDWTAANRFSWTPPATGAYWIQVWVRNAGSASQADAWGTVGPIEVIQGYYD